MEASLPASTAYRPAVESATAGARPNAHAPSTTLPLRFIATGILALAAGTAWLILQPEILANYHYAPATVAATHLFVLGWIVSVIMGAMYQLVPVALETKLYSERLARWQFLFHVVGFAGMVLMFRVWNMKQVGHFGSLMAAGLILFVYNIVRTLFRIPRWNVIAFAIASSLFWILFAGIAGLSMAASKCVYGSTYESAALGGFIHSLRAIGMFMSRFAPMSAMHAHAHLGVIGFILMLIVGVSYKLVPMFTLSEVQSPRRAKWSVGLLNAGLAGTFLAVLLQSNWKPACGLIVMVALALYLIEIAAILKARKRRVLDWGLRCFVTAIGLLIPTAVIGLILSRPGMPLTSAGMQLENVYGFLALIGVVSLAIIGMLYKIVPFLVWFGTYSGHIGRFRVPALAEMYSARLQAAGYCAYLAGVLGTCVAILARNEICVRLGCILLAAGVATLLANLGLMLSHYLRPRLLPMKKTPTHAPTP